MLFTYILPTLALLTLASSQRPQPNHTVYLMHCNSTSLNWGGGADYRDKLEIGIYLYGTQSTPNQLPWHWGTATSGDRTRFDYSWGDGKQYIAEMNGENENVYARNPVGSDKLGAGEKAGSAEWWDEFFECRRDDGRLLYEDDKRLDETFPAAKYLCYSDYVCPFVGYNYTEGRLA